MTILSFGLAPTDLHLADKEIRLSCHCLGLASRSQNFISKTLDWKSPITPLQGKGPRKGIAPPTTDHRPTLPLITYSVRIDLLLSNLDSRSELFYFCFRLIIYTLQLPGLLLIEGKITDSEQSNSMGASQSSQPPPSRNHSRHGNVDNKHKQRASSVSAPMKTPLPPIAIEKTESTAPSIISDPPRSVPAPSIAVPIPVKKKPTSLPASGENSYIDNHRDADLLHKHIKELDVEDTEEEMDETEVRAKFGIAWVASDDFAADEKVGGIRTFHILGNLLSGPKFPLEIVWNGTPNDKEVYVLGTFTERKALKLKKK